MSAGRRGSDRERQVMANLRDDGWVVYRAAGSHGCADLVALKRERKPLLVQVKCSAQGPFEHFGPEERRLLVEQAEVAGADAFLCWWPSRKKPQWLHSDVWPAGRPTRKKLERLIEASGGDTAHALRVAHITGGERS
jgi:Holliday junction resolvase